MNTHDHCSRSETSTRLAVRPGVWQVSAWARGGATHHHDLKSRCCLFPPPAAAASRAAAGLLHDGAGGASPTGGRRAGLRLLLLGDRGDGEPKSHAGSRARSDIPSRSKWLTDTRSRHPPPTYTKRPTHPDALHGRDRRLPPTLARSSGRDHQAACPTRISRASVSDCVAVRHHSQHATPAPLHVCAQSCLEPTLAQQGGASASRAAGPS